MAEDLKTNGSPNHTRVNRSMNGGEHREDYLKARFGMSGKAYILTRGDLALYNETNAASEVS